MRQAIALLLLFHFVRSASLCAETHTPSITHPVDTDGKEAVKLSEQISAAWKESEDAFAKAISGLEKAPKETRDHVLREIARRAQTAARTDDDSMLFLSAVLEKLGVEGAPFVPLLIRRFGENQKDPIDSGVVQAQVALLHAIGEISRDCHRKLNDKKNTTSKEETLILSKAIAEAMPTLAQVMTKLRNDGIWSTRWEEGPTYAAKVIKDLGPRTKPINDTLAAYLKNPLAVYDPMIEASVEGLHATNELPKLQDELIQSSLTRLERIWRGDEKGSDGGERSKLEYLRRYLPQDKKGELDRKIVDLRKRNRLGLSRAEACDFVCGLAAKDEWIREYANSPELADRDSWKVAVMSLGSLFLLKAGEICDKAGKTRNLLINDWLNRSGSRKAHPFSPLISNARKFLEPFKDLEKMTDEAFVGRVKRSGSAFIFALQFQLLLMEELRNVPELTKSEREILEELRKQESSVLLRAFKNYERLPNGAFGSLFTNYSLPTAFLSLSDEALAQPVASGTTKTYRELITEALERSIPKEKKKVAIGYDYRGGWATERGAAARAVPFYLALHLKGSNSGKRAQYGELLAKALDNFDLNLLSLLGPIPSSEAHVGPDGLAPYFFYPGVPYASLSGAALTRKLPAESPQRATFEKISTDVQMALLNQVQRNRLFEPHSLSKEGYPSSPGYVNPLAGLALLNSLGSCYGKSIKGNGLIVGSTF